MATKQEKWQEIANRGLQDKLSADVRPKFDEAIKRGLITMPNQVESEQPAPAIIEQALPVNEADAKPEFFGSSISEPLLTVGSSMVAEPLAGLAGIAGSILPGEAGQGADFVKNTREALTYQPKTESGQGSLQKAGEFLKPVGEAFGAVEKTLGETTLEVTGSPELAAIAHTLPTAVLEALGVRGAIKSARAVDAPTITPEVIQTQKDFASKGFTSPYGGLQSADKQKQLIDAITSGDKQKIAAMIDADPEFASAMTELGLKEPGLPSAASKDVMFRETEQALKKMPGSELSKVESNAIKELQQKSDDLITEFGGRLDKSDISVDLAERSQKSIDELNSVTKTAYDEIAKEIPKATLSKMDNIGESLREELANLGGDMDQLSPLERRLLKMSESENITYHAIDKIRKEVGETLGKTSDKFKSESTGALKRVYKLLTKDQEVTAIERGMGDKWNAAKGLVTTRKGLEDNAVKMFGKDLHDSFMPKMGVAVKKMTSGDYKKFNELLESVPPTMRQEVVVSALNDAFTTGSRKEKQLSVAGYADFFNGLNKNKAAKKMLYDELPEGLPAKLDALGRVSNGIRNAQASAPVGGQIMAAQGVFDKVTNGIAKKVFSKFPGMIGDLVEVGLDKSKSKGFDKAIEVLSDPDFVNNISAIAQGQQRKAAALERKLMRKKKTQDFIATLPVKEAKLVSQLGLIGWLSSSTKESTDKDKK